MPTITLSKKGVLAAAGKALNDDELKDRISMLGTNLEKIEGDTIEVEIFPNRPDLLSQQGFFRAFATFLGTRHGLARYDVTASGEKVIIDKSVEKCRPYTACAIVKTLTIDEEKLKEIIILQEKLHVTFGRNRKRLAIGIYPCEHISFPVHFKGLKPDEIKFRPLEARNEMTGQQILEEHPKGKEYAHLVQGLDRYACFLDGKGKIMSLTPIINSHLTGKITEETKEVFIECSGFDLRILQECLAMIVTALADMGGKIFSLELEYPDKKIVTPDLTPRKMDADMNYINKLLGLHLTDHEFKKLFEKMGYGYEKGAVLVPAYRTDVLHQVDLAEDIAIAYGYEHIPETIPNVATAGKESDFEEFCRTLRVLLVGHGLLETKGYNLISKKTQTKKMLNEKEVITLSSCVSEEYDSLRVWVLPSMMEVLQRNRRYEFPQHLFEIGRVFAKKAGTETGVKEKVRLAVVLCGEREDYTAIRQVLDSVFAALDLEPQYRETEHSSFLDGRVARVKVGKEDVAYVGEIHPHVLENFGLTMPCAALELDLTTLFEIIKNREREPGV